MTVHRSKHSRDELCASGPGVQRYLRGVFRELIAGSVQTAGEVHPAVTTVGDASPGESNRRSLPALAEFEQVRPP